MKPRPASTPRLALPLLASAVVALTAVAAPAQCPYGSIQTRAQLNEAMDWRTSLTLPQYETFRVGVFRDGAGIFAGAGVTVTVLHPNGVPQTLSNGGYVRADLAGTYTVVGSCPPSSETITVTATARARPIWGLSPQQANATNFTPFFNELDKIRDAGATATHLSFNWDIIEKSPGVRGWSYADNQVNAALSRGLTPFVFTGASASWALPAPNMCTPCTAGSTCSNGSACPDNRLCPTPGPCPAEAFYMPDESRKNEFIAFHRDLAARFCGRVRYYEFWNEPNGCGLNAFGSPAGCQGFTTEKKAVYAKWLKRWYEAMKSGCKDTVLSIGGFDCHVGVPCSTQLNELYAAISANPEGSCLNGCFDAFSLHPYGDNTANQVLNWSTINAVLSTLQAHGQSHKLVWLDEWAVANSGANASLISSALNSIRSYNAVLEARYLTLTDADVGGGGLTEPNLTPRASYWAFCNNARTNNSFVPAGNWKGEYFKNTTLSGTTWYRDDGASSLYFNWGSGGPVCDFPGDNFSARWTRTLTLPAATYRFTTRTDDGVRLWVDGVQVINQWQPQGPTVYTADRALAAGSHTIKMEYFEQGGGATAQLSWPIVSTTVCGNIGAQASCDANPACQWFACANFCLPRYTANPPTCTCAASTTVTACEANSGLGCGWYTCKNKCLAAGTSTYAVCGYGT